LVSTALGELIMAAFGRDLAHAITGIKRWRGKLSLLRQDMWINAIWGRPLTANSYVRIAPRSATPYASRERWGLGERRNEKDGCQ
jgi:hypothetical protein